MARSTSRSTLFLLVLVALGATLLSTIALFSALVARVSWASAVLVALGAAVAFVVASVATKLSFMVMGKDDRGAAWSGACWLTLVLQLGVVAGAWFGLDVKSETLLGGTRQIFAIGNATVHDVKSSFTSDAAPTPNASSALAAVIPYPAPPAIALSPAASAAVIEQLNGTVLFGFSFSSNWADPHELAAQLDAFNAARFTPPALDLTQPLTTAEREQAAALLRDVKLRIADRAIRTWLPVSLQKLGYTDDALFLRNMDPFTDVVALATIETVIDQLLKNYKMGVGPNAMQARLLAEKAHSGISSLKGITPTPADPSEAQVIGIRWSLSMTAGLAQIAASVLGREEAIAQVMDAEAMILTEADRLAKHARLSDADHWRKQVHPFLAGIVSGTALAPLPAADLPDLRSTMGGNSVLMLRAAEDVLRRRNLLAVPLVSPTTLDARDRSARMTVFWIPQNTLAGLDRIRAFAAEYGGQVAVATVTAGPQSIEVAKEVVAAVARAARETPPTPTTLMAQNGLRINDVQKGIDETIHPFLFLLRERMRQNGNGLQAEELLAVDLRGTLASDEETLRLRALNAIVKPALTARLRKTRLDALVADIAALPDITSRAKAAQVKNALDAIAARAPISPESMFIVQVSQALQIASTDVSALVKKNAVLGFYPVREAETLASTISDMAFGLPTGTAIQLLRDVAAKDR